MSSRRSSSGPEAIRYIGDARIELSWSDQDLRDPHGRLHRRANAYYGRVVVPSQGSRGHVVWKFDDLEPSPYDLRTKAVDSDEMFDKMAQAAASFGSDEGANPDSWEEIEYAVVQAMDDRGNYDVRSSRSSGSRVSAGKRPHDQDPHSLGKRPLRRDVHGRPLAYDEKHWGGWEGRREERSPRSERGERSSRKPLDFGAGSRRTRRSSDDGWVMDPKLTKSLQAFVRKELKKTQKAPKKGKRR